MRHIAFLIGLAMLTSAGVARAELAAGQAAPDFTSPAAIGGDEFSFTLSEALKKGPVVLYFYPAAFTRGCTVEAHEFASALDRYTALGASVVGVSGDTIATLQKFSISECQSKFPLVADFDRRVMTAYDSVLNADTGRASRTSYVITPDDRVLYVYKASSPEDHVANTYQALAAWRTQHPIDQ
jgi:peroxiredoxin